MTNFKKPPQAEFVTVKHGNNEEVFLVTWCKVKVFLQHLREKCLGEIPTAKINKELDLLDLEGNVRTLPDHLDDYTSELVPPRKTYILLEVQKGPEVLKYTALLSDFNKSHPKLRARLEELSQTPLQRTASGRWAALKSVTKFNSLANKKSSHNLASESDTARSESRKGSVNTESGGKKNNRQTSNLDEKKKKTKK